MIKGLAPMADNFDTIRLKNWLKRLKGGDRAARDELIRASCARLEALARTMLRRFPNVGRYAEVDDVFQGAILRLLRGLEKLPIESTKDFYRLAAQQIRRELLDLARHYTSSKGPKALLEANFQDDSEENSGMEEFAGEEPTDLEQWSSFHAAVETLPADEREAFSLIFYHGWKQAEVSEMLHVSERTVRRWFDSAMEKLKQTVREGNSNG